jgi:hypothetical protein
VCVCVCVCVFVCVCVHTHILSHHIHADASCANARMHAHMLPSHHHIQSYASSANTVACCAHNLHFRSIFPSSLLRPSVHAPTQGKRMHAHSTAPCRRNTHNTRTYTPGACHRIAYLHTAIVARVVLWREQRLFHHQRRYQTLALPPGQHNHLQNPSTCVYERRWRPHSRVRAHAHACTSNACSPHTQAHTCTHRQAAATGPLIREPGLSGGLRVYSQITLHPNADGPALTLGRLR